MDFTEKLEAYLSDSNTNPKKCESKILLGDTNVAVNLSDNSTTGEYLRILESCNMFVTNNVVTRPSSGNILDHVVCSESLLSSVTNKTIPTDASDHSVGITTLFFNQPRSVQLLNKKITNQHQLNTELGVALLSIPLVTDANGKIRYIIEKYEEIKNRATRTITVEAKVKAHCPWMSVDVWQLMSTKDKLLKASRRNPSDQRLKDLLKQASKKLNDKKRQCKRNYYFKLLQTATPKKSWKVLNEILGINSKSSSNTSLLVDGRTINDPLQAADCLNDFFCNIGHNLASELNSDKDICKFGTLRSHFPSLFMRPTTVEEIIVLINNLNTNKAPGPDKIPASTIKTHHLAFAQILKDVFNEIIETGAYLEALKIARVAPIFKPGDKSNPSNYRPISTLSTMNKILEQLISSRLTNFLEAQNLLTNRQYGFRKGCDTLTATGELLEEVYCDLDNRRYSGALFLDLKKAFDTINHELLLKKTRNKRGKGICPTFAEKLPLKPSAIYFLVWH
ncbi:uncharacterized protein LOC129753162 [Uranotaenia lowii]|uniref:uncharacterized protein LOC129753162 n=1 Tax=Uranotaenia lowii TaxID=190385 RepID=UPI0024784294|nr:uncharacterized protein LOC129753162 [Uranotaenia lowii]